MEEKVDKIKNVIFGTLTESEWKKFAVVEIKKPGNRGNSDVEHTPYDLRLGALENGVVCETCFQKNKDCPGHWGYINLEEACYNPIYMDVITSIFKCTCINCKQVRLTNEMLIPYNSLKQESKFRAIKKKADTITHCPHCGVKLFSFRLERNEHTIKQFYKEKRQVSTDITAEEAYNLLCQYSFETMQKLGFNADIDLNNIPEGVSIPPGKKHPHELRPESFIYKVFPVIPTCARPWITKDGDRKDDDLTDKYNIILKANSKLREERENTKKDRRKMPTPEKKKMTENDRKKIVNDLFTNIRMLLDNSKEKSKNTNRHSKGINDRLGGKDGHLQLNVSGKRSDHNGRTVIAGGSDSIPMGWIGVPEQIMKTLSVPEYVSDSNIDILKKILSDGKINQIDRGNMTIIVSPKYAYFKNIQIKKGDIVHRQLKDGDWGLFNRQPTLRIESMQGVQLKCLPGEKVFRLPLGMTRPFNADFDGDEMNLHIPQHIGGRIECSTICRTDYHIVSPQNCAPVMGCVQNTLVCMYLLTETFKIPPENITSKTINKPTVKFEDGTMGYETFVSIEDYEEALTKTGNYDRLSEFIERAKKYYPEYITKNNTFAKLIPGKLAVSIVFPKNFTWSRRTETNEKLPLVEIKDGIILPTSGPLCKKIIGGTSGSAIHPLWKTSPSTATKFITELQFMTTVFIKRIGFSMGISDCLATKTEDIKNSIREAKIKCEIINSTEMEKDEKEREINGALNEAMSIAPKMAKNSMNKGDRNSLVIMKKSGAKGSDINNGQISGFVGQQNIDGKRIPFMLSNNTRSLPYFVPGDNSPEAKGFIEHSYLDGLKPNEVWSHAVAGRRGVVDTALKTADSGYIQKKIVKKMEDYKTYDDGTVRDSNGYIIQYIYGGDGLNPKELIWCDGVKSPFFCNVYHIAESLNTQAEKLNDKIDIGLKRILMEDETEYLLSLICVGYGNTETTKRTTFNIKSLLRVLLCKVKIYEYMIPRFCKTILDAYENSKSRTGNMVGLTASCAIGEPSTQMTLNTFHSTGQSSKDVTLGIPRLKELLGTTKKPSKVLGTIYLKKQPKDIIEASSIARSLSYIEIDMLVKKYRIKYLNTNDQLQAGPIGIKTYEHYEPSWWVELSKTLNIIPNFGDQKAEPQSWIICLEFDIEKLYYYNVSLTKICEKIHEASKDLVCIPSPLNVGMIDIYINFDAICEKISIDFDKVNEMYTPENFAYFLTRDCILKRFIKNIKIQGIEGIKKSYTEQNRGEFYINTQGSNLKEILPLDIVDETKTISNDMWEVYKVFGIEAARSLLISEITRILSFDGTYINPRHITLLVDSICKTGIMTGVNRDGITRDVGPIAKGLFEKSIENFKKASVFGEKDNMNGVSASVMFGTLSKSGTGIVTVTDKDKISCII